MVKHVLVFMFDWCLQERGLIWSDAEDRKRKKFLKKRVFGDLVKMPAEIEEGMAPYQAPVKLLLGQADRKHKVIYCVARLA